MGAETIALIAAGLSLAGAGATAVGNEQSHRAMESAAQDEMARQKGYQKKATEQYQQSAAVSDVATAQQQARQGEQQRLEQYAQAAKAPLVATQSPLDTQSQTITQQQGGQAQQQLAGAAQARMGGMSEWDLQQWIKNIRANQMLGIIGANARNSAQVLPMELAGAQHKGDAWRMGGTVLGALGALGGGYASFLSAPAQASTLATGSAIASAAAPAGVGLYGAQYRTPYMIQPLQ